MDTTHERHTSIPYATASDIEDALHRYCQAKILEAGVIGKGAKDLWTEIDAYISGGGKRLRPRIFMMIHHFYASHPSDGALAVACAWEMLHTSVLIHDDIIDRDTMRHGKPNITGRYQAIYGTLTTNTIDHYALSAALLAGDLLLSSAYDLISHAALEPEQKIAMQQYIHKAIFTVGAGELLDTESALYPITSVDPYAIALYKTASYSFQLPMESGATLAGASKSELQKLHAIGAHVGIAFQLKDDLLGIFGDSSVTGKSNRSDIIEKKRTLLIQKVLEKVPAHHVERIHELYTTEHALTDEEAEEIYAIIVGTNVRQEIETLVEEGTHQALEIVKTLEIHSEDQEMLSHLIGSLVGRQA